MNRCLTTVDIPSGSISFWREARRSDCFREVPRLSLRDENEREGVADNEVDTVVAGLLMPRELPVIEESGTDR